MSKFLLVGIGLILLITAVMALAKGLLLLSTAVIGLVLLMRVYQVRPMAFYALGVAGVVALLPKAAWLWLGMGVIFWLVLEFAIVIFSRLSHPKAPLRLPT